MSVFTDHFRKGDHASRPAAGAAGLPKGAKYACSDHGLVYETDGTTWSTWFDPSNTSATVAEFIRDTMGTALVAGTGVTITVDDAGDHITIASSGSYTDEQARDAIGAALVAGTGMTITVDDAGDHITLASSGSYSDEQARDAIGAALVAGTGMTITVDDAGDHITLASSGGGGGGNPLDPTSLNATYGDHFTGASLDAAWTRVGYTSSGESYQQGGGTWLQQDTTKSGGPNYYYRAAPAGDFTIVMSAVCYGSALMFGPMIVDNSGNGIAGFCYNNSDGHWVATVAGGSYSGSSAQTVSEPTANHVNSGAPTWYKLVKTGTSYTFTLSTNGKVWRPMTAAATSAITPTRIGFGNVINTMNGFAIDFFDVQ